MNHPFNKSSTNPSLCNCGFDYLSHTKAAKCSICGSYGEVEINDNILKCASCINDFESVKTSTVLDADTIVRLLTSDLQNNMRYSGDFFNLRMTPHHKVKESIFADTTLNDEQKHQKYFNYLADCQIHLKKTIFEQETAIHGNNVEMLGISNELRAFGEQVRKETRDRIKQADEFYAPAIVNKPKVVPKVKNKLSALDKMINAMMEMTGKSETECRLLIEKGNFNKDNK